MCRLKSGIILKDQMFVPDYDSHTDMLEELGIKDNEFNATTLFVGAELSPVDGNIFSDVSTWKFNVDQDILPGWFVYEYDKQRMVEAVKEWVKGHVFENVDNLLELKGEGKYYLKNCKNVEVYNNCEVVAYDNCKIYAYDNSVVKAQNKCMVTICDNCKVSAYNSCVIKAQGKSTITVFNNCTVSAFNDCKVYAYGNCTVYPYNNCTVKAFNNCTVNTQDKYRVTVTR